MPGGIKLFKNEKACFSSLFWVKNFFKMIDLLAIFASEHGKQLLSRLYVAISLFYAEKCPKDAEDREVGELCGSAQPHPVRCSVIRVVHATFYTGNKHQQKSFKQARISTYHFYMRHIRVAINFRDLVLERGR